MIEKIKKISASTLICLILISFMFCNLSSVKAAGNEKEYAEYMAAWNDYVAKQALWEKEKAINPFSAASISAMAAMKEAKTISEEKYDISVAASIAYDAKVASEAAAKAEADAKAAAKEQSGKWWEQANTFFDNKGEIIGTDPLKPLIATIKVAGNAVIIIATIFLGIKYMYGSVDGKVEVKEGLFTLVIAMLFFYAGTTVYDILVTDNKLIFIGVTSDSTIFNIYSTVIYIAKFIAIGGIIYVGVKYLAAGAEGKAELKGKGVPFFIGIVMTFGTLSFLSFIQTVLADVLATK